MNLQLDGELAKRLAAESGMSDQDYAVLVALTGVAGGRMRLYELAAILGWEKSRLSHHINRMVNRGLVCKEQCPSDRRGLFVGVTDLGRAEIDAAAPGHVRAVRELFLRNLSRKQLEDLATIVETVLHGMGRGEPFSAIGPPDC
jgi:DNA-binding MarR family transcriptional regulator